MSGPTLSKGSQALLRFVGLALWLSCVCLPNRAAVAQNTESSDTEQQAGSHFQRGVEYYEDGDYRSALLEFQRAYELRPAYQLLYNLGQVAAELRDYAGAEAYFRRYLREGKDAIATDRRSEVNAELARMKTRIGSLRIRTNLPGAQIHVDERLIEHPEAGPVRVSAGRRTIVAEKAGFAPVRRSVDVLGGDELHVVMEFAGPERPPQTSLQADRATTATDPLPWITGIASAALLVGAGAVGFWAYADSTEYNDALRRFTTQAELDRLHSRAQTKALVADILLGTAVVGGIVTTVLLVTGESTDSPDTAALKPHATLGVGGLAVQF